MAPIPAIGFLAGVGNAIVIAVDASGNFSLSNNLPASGGNVVPVYCASGGTGSLLKITDYGLYASSLINLIDSSAGGVRIIGTAEGFVSQIILDPINDAIIAGAYTTSFAALFGNNFASLFDNFNGANGAVSGRQPSVGNPWSTTGSGAANGIITSNELTQNASGVTCYTTNNPNTPVGEIGCTFRISVAENRMNVGGTASTGAQLIANIYPSGNANFYQVVYTLLGTDTLASAATAFATAITNNATSISNNITATANGTTVAVKATETPRVVVAATGSVTLGSANSPAPTLANYPTGGNFLNGMLHFRLGIEGLCDWTFYNGGQVAFSTFQRNSALRGLSTGVTYTYRCCVAPPYAWGGLWNGSTLLNRAVCQDPNMGAANYRGMSVFLENGLDANSLYYDSAWVYQNPSVSRAAILNGLT